MTGRRWRIETVADAGDPRLHDYRDLKERDLSARGGRFIAESERVVRRLLESGLPVCSVLLTPARLGALGDLFGAGDPAAAAAAASAPGPDGGAPTPTPVPVPVFVAAQPVLDAITGFHVHRGCLAVGERPAGAAVPSTARTLVVLEDLVDVDNLGAMARNAAAFGADALVLSPRAADPFYRKAIRVGMGTVFRLPVVRLGSWPDDLVALKRDRGFTLLGAVLDVDAEPLAAVVPRAHRVALLLGSEGPGLSAAARAVCDRLITIPMAPGADSLNVATAGAIALYHLQQASAPPLPRWRRRPD